MIRAGEWVPVMAVRVLIGMFFCISGGTKLFVKTPFGVFEQTMIESHILATSLCAAMLVGDRIVAIATNRIYSIQATGGLAGLDDFLYVPEVLYTLILFLVRAKCWCALPPQALIRSTTSGVPV